MIVVPDSEDFILDHAFGFDFCRAIETCSPKNDNIYISSDGRTFSIFAQSASATVWGEENIVGGKTFSLGIESDKFVSLFKRLYAGSPIRLTPTAAHLLVREDNISVRFPLTAYVKHLQPSKRTYIDTGADEGAVKWFVDSVCKCEGAIGNSRRFPGVLVDNTSDLITRLVKFSETAARSCAYSKIPLEDGSLWRGRIVVSPEMAKTFQRFKDHVTEVMFSWNIIGAHLDSGVRFATSLMEDDLPQKYTELFKLLDAPAQVDPIGRKYTFNKQRMLEVLELVAAVVGAEESLILCELSGVATHPVWRVSAQTFNGCEASEQIECTAPSATDMPPFKIHKNRALSAIKLYGESLIFYDNDETLLIITNADGSDVTLLVKVPA